MQRQQELAGRKGGMPVIQSWTQGAAHMMDKLFEGLEQGRTNRRIEEGNAVIADVLASADPVTGLIPLDKADAAAAWDPELYRQLMQDRQQNRQFEMTLEAQKAKTAADAGPKPTDVAAMYDDFNNVPDVKKYQNAQSMWRSMQDAAIDDTTQADQNMVIALAKIYDPDSVVRDKETDQIVATGGAFDELSGYLAYLRNDPNARLSRSVRQGMMKQAFSRLNGYYSGVQEASQYFTQKAKRWNYRPEDVVRPFEAPMAFDPEKVVGRDSEDPANPDTPPETPRYIVGQTYTFTDENGRTTSAKYLGGDPLNRASWE
jgi:hypothetical protein